MAAEQNSLPLERVLQVMMAALAALATLMLGMGEQNPLLPLLAIVVAVGSVYFTDIKGWIQLNTSIANLAGLAAVVASLWDYKHVTHEHQLLALANLLIYLQCVLLFRPKTARIYWMLALLSLLQVAVATVLNLSVWFGVLLVIYLFVALITLSVFSIFREQGQFDALFRHAEPDDEVAPQAAPRRGSPAKEPETFGPRANPAASGRLPAGLFRQVGRMGICTLGLTAALFIVVPRTGGGSWGEMGGELQHMVGFTEEVKLGELGEIIENPEEVLQIRFFDDASGTLLHLTDVPLIRGSVLLRYTHGGWWATKKSVEKERPPEVTPGQTGLVRQDVQVGKLDTTTLFGIYPLWQRDADTRLSYDQNADRLTRNQNVTRFPINYGLLTTGLKNGRQLGIIPCSRPQEWTDSPSTSDKNELLQLPGDPELKKLRQLTELVLQPVDPNDMLAQAQVLERFLRDSGRYRYSLTPPGRDNTLDPIEDFLTKNRQGHCEYFASALTLMCRSAGIPARMLVGFKGADWNPLTGYYHVRQLHAHTWVEVYLRPDQLPPGTWSADQTQGEDAPPAVWQHGGWLRLDPTPGANGDEAMPAASDYPSFRHLLAYVDYLWAGYVLSMDSKRQQENIFKPVKRGSQGVIAMLFDRDSWMKTFANIWTLLKGERLDDTGLWFSWRAALLTIFALMLLLGCYKVARRLMRSVLYWGTGREQPSGVAHQAEVEFYRRLESLLAGHQLVRPPTQTQREFARQATQRLAEHPPTERLADTPRRVVEAFYRVRFGGLALDNPEALAIEQALEDLAAALAPNGHAPQFGQPSPTA